MAAFFIGINIFMAIAQITSFRNKQYADWMFGAQSPGQYMYAVPRYQWMYYANFVVNSQAAMIYPWLRELGSVNGISFKIKKVDKPNIDLKTKTLNQYNRKRPVYTNVDYKPVNLSIWDTVDNKPLDMWRQYFTYYFGDARQKSPLTMNQSPVAPVFSDGTGWGLRPLTEEINFFTRLDVYAIFGLKYTRVSYLNPRITNINFNSYQSDVDQLADISMQVAYETVNYDPSQDITPAIAAQFGFDLGPPAVEPDVSTAGVIRDALANVADTMISQYIANSNQPAASIIGTAAAAIANFGLSKVSYNAFTKTNGTKTGMGTTLGTPGSVTYSSATSAFDNVYYTTAPVANNYSNNSVYNALAGAVLAGLPFGSLPASTAAIAAPFLTTFAVALNPNNSTLSTYGNYNFGTGGMQTAPTMGITSSNSGNNGGTGYPFNPQGTY